MSALHKIQSNPDTVPSRTQFMEDVPAIKEFAAILGNRALLLLKFKYVQLFGFIHSLTHFLNVYFR